MKTVVALVLGVAIASAQAFADERYFTYSYEANVLPKGAFEIEQWVTSQAGKKDGKYSQWDYRTEFEYGVTERYMTALYANWSHIHSEGVSGVEEDSGTTRFGGFSWENVYQILNPNLNPVGLATYLEYTTDGDNHELEGKILLSKPFSNGLTAVLNGVYEAEWEKEEEDGETEIEHEAEIQLTGGLSYKLSPAWAMGVEARYAAAFPGGYDLRGREFQAVSVGPNVHYGSPHWWATLTFLPQVWGDGDGASGGRQLVHEENFEVRLIFGYIFG